MEELDVAFVTILHCPIEYEDYTRSCVYIKSVGAQECVQEKFIYLYRRHGIFFEE